MIKRLGHTAAMHRRTVLFAWLVVLVAGVALGPALFGALETDMGGSEGTESERAYQQLGQLRRHGPPQPGDGPELYAVVDGVPVDDPAVRASVTATTSDVRAMPGVEAVLDAYDTPDPRLRSEDGRASAIVVTFTPAFDHEREERQHAVRARLEAIDAPTVLVGNEDMVDDEIGEQAEKDLTRGEMIALPIAFVVMVLVFRGLLAAALPVLLSLVAVAGAFFVLLAATVFGDVVVYSINVVTMFGIGLGIDYGLLVISRFREERARGYDVREAIDRTQATAGVTVAFSGLTVAVALAGLLVFDSEGLRSLAVGGIGVVLMAVAAALTILPALLSVFGDRIRPSMRGASERGAFSRIAGFVQRRALPVAVVAAVLLAVAAVPFAGARFENPDARSLPRSSEARQLDDIRRNRFPAVGAEPIEVVARVAPDDARLAAYVKRVRAFPGVTSVNVSPVAPGVAAAVVEVVPEGTDQGEAAQSLVHRLRDDRPPFPTSVTGEAAELIDFKTSIADRLPLASGLVVLATLLLIFLMTGSVVVAAKAVFMNVLSLGATFGTLVWVFQDGNLAGVLGFDAVGSLDATMPLVIFIFAFGLSMDYEVFLLSRIKEAWDATGDNDVAVARGLQRSGHIITSAALLIVVVFAGFAAGELLLVKQLGVGLAVAVIVDATIVRMLLVPATMTLMGRWNWWAPAFLARIHDRFGLHEPAGEPAAQPFPVTSPVS
jgi:putative drug exporter of the RND superfamily